MTPANDQTRQSLVLPAREDLLKHFAKNSAGVKLAALLLITAPRIVRAAGVALIAWAVWQKLH